MTLNSIFHRLIQFQEEELEFQNDRKFKIIFFNSNGNFFSIKLIKIMGEIIFLNFLYSQCSI